MSESFLDLNYISFFILSVQDFGCKAFEQTFSKELVFELDAKHVFYGVKFIQIQTSRWAKWDGLIKPFHVSL
jgi:hypothetical protein